MYKGFWILFWFGRLRFKNKPANNGDKKLLKQITRSNFDVNSLLSMRERETGTLQSIAFTIIQPDYLCCPYNNEPIGKLRC